jgi:MoxR-like ATPase
MLMYGASPRASIAMVESARALAALRGRAYVLPEDLQAVAMKTLRHRIGLSDEAIATRVNPDTLVRRVLDTVPVPPRPMA